MGRAERFTPPHIGPLNNVGKLFNYTVISFEDESISNISSIVSRRPVPVHRPSEMYDQRLYCLKFVVSIASQGS